MASLSFSTTKKRFLSVIDDIQENINNYVNLPGKDMVRKRKCPLDETLLTIFSFTAKRLNTELLEHFSLKGKAVPTKSAFTQQRLKLNDKLFPHFLESFNKKTPFRKKHKGFVLIAVDGTDVNLPTDRNDNTYAVKQARSDNYYYQMHVTALFNICENRYVDLTIQPRPAMNENLAFREMVTSYSKQCSKKTIFIADRGFASLQNLAYMQESGQYFLIRAQGPNAPASFLKSLVEDDTEFDVDVSFGVTRSRKNIYRKNPGKYKYIRPDRCFEPIAPDDKDSVYPINIRVVCIRLESGIYEYLVTNLPRKSFSTEEFKDLYFMRWGIETSFRTLKYTLELSHLHSKNRDLIIQEIYAKAILYNFASLIHSHASESLTYTSKKGYNYKVSFENAIPIARMYLLGQLKKSTIKALILNHLTQIQKASDGTRKVRSQRANPLNNRA